MKKFITFCILVVTFQVNAAIISLQPSTSTIDVGDSFILDIVISQLALGGSPSIGAFDLNLNFTNTILGIDDTDSDNDGVFDSVTLDPNSELDTYDMGINFTGTQFLASGVLNMFALSLDLPQDLDSFQSRSFTLAQIQMVGTQAGMSTVAVSINDLSDANGNNLQASINSSQITVNGNTPIPVPEPNILILILMSAVGFALKACRKN